MQDTVWVTARKERLLVSQMETRHVIDCINLIRRKWPWRKEFLPRLELELDIRRIMSQ